MGILNEFKANAKAFKERVESSEAYKVMKSRITAGRNSFQGDFAFADNGKSILEHEKEPVSAPVSAKNAASNASGHKESSKSQGAPQSFCHLRSSDVHHVVRLLHGLSQRECGE